MSTQKKYINHNKPIPDYPTDDVLRPVEYTPEIHIIVEETCKSIYTKHYNFYQAHSYEFDDYFNEAAERCWKGLAKHFKGQCAVTSFIYITCLNHHRNLMTKFHSKKYKALSRSVPWKNDSDWDEDNPNISRSEYYNSDQITGDLMEDVLANRQIVLRKLLYMRRNIGYDKYHTMYRVVKGMKYDDIAEEDGCSSALIRHRFYAFMDVLKKLRVDDEEWEGDFDRTDLVYI